jgi:hypothetical protein
MGSGRYADLIDLKYQLSNCFLKQAYTELENIMRYTAMFNA